GAGSATCQRTDAAAGSLRGRSGRTGVRREHKARRRHSRILTAIGGVRHSPVFPRQRATTLCSLLHAATLGPFYSSSTLDCVGTPWGGGWSGHLHSGRKRSRAVRECCAPPSGRPSPHGLKILASLK